MLKEVDHKSEPYSVKVYVKPRTSLFCVFASLTSEHTTNPIMMVFSHSHSDQIYFVAYDLTLSSVRILLIKYFLFSETYDFVSISARFEPVSSLCTINIPNAVHSLILW